MNFFSTDGTQHLIVAYLGYQILSALVQSLPTPGEIKGVWYKAFYNFSTVIVGDFKSFVPKLPVSSTIGTDSEGEINKVITSSKPGIAPVISGIASTRDLFYQQKFSDTVKGDQNG